MVLRSVSVPGCVWETANLTDLYKICLYFNLFHYSSTFWFDNHTTVFHSQAIDSVSSLRPTVCFLYSASSLVYEFTCGGSQTTECVFCLFSDRCEVKHDSCCSDWTAADKCGLVFWGTEQGKQSEMKKKKKKICSQIQYFYLLFFSICSM